MARKTQRIIGQFKKPTYEPTTYLQLQMRRRARELPPATFSIIIIIGLVVVANISSNRVLAEGDEFLEVDPVQVSQVVDTIGEYTDLLDEDTEAVQEIIANENHGYLEKPLTLETNRSPITYQVNQGDTLSTIAEKHNLTVATILEANKFSADKILKVGETITIPAEITSTSTDWLRDLQEKQRQQELARAQLRNQSSRSNTKLARRGREASVVERSSEGYDGESNNFSNPLVSTKGITRRLRYGHTGVDARLNTGDPVLSSAAGRVIEITTGWGQGWGKSIVLSHGGGWTTRYAHLSEISVSLGETVEQRQIVGYGGSSGRSTGPHLHYERRINGRPIDPSELR